MALCARPQPESSLADDANRGAQDQAAPTSQWSALLNLLKARLDEASREDGQQMSLEDHNASYRAVFARVRKEVSSRDDIPNAVMDPPARNLHLTFHGGWNKKDCLGCLNYHDANDIIHVAIHAKDDDPDGVTKDDLLRCICEVLYGGLHIVRRESGEETGIVLSDLNWMGTISLCNLLDTVVYVGYMPVDGSVLGQGQGDEQVTPLPPTFKVLLEAGTLGDGISSIQGYDHNYCRELAAVKGWKKEDWDVASGF
ncbi:hypothetical protein GGR52DRAFT_562625 [Hypoxylon sp. FL1284]|nr:hypothetical protein GGR52DRAFT_562625 [Hypoxylon sp. FL1284]